MPSFIANAAIVAAAVIPAALAQETFIPLAEKRFEYNNLPFQVDTDDGERGRQFGYNLCNATTENQESLCQTAIINAIDDFCLWGPPEPNSLIGDTEGEAVAWCTKPGHGTRLIPEGAITGVQFVKTPDYIQVTGRIEQDLINIAADDSGGEMDPHGADRRGNPLGGLLFSDAYNGQMQQVIEWHNFMGGGTFCLKACDPAGPDAARYCEHVFDRIGCFYNAPAPYVEGVFESCVGDNQDFPGIYTDEGGNVQTYTQPPEELGEISTMPWQPKTPASSSCTTFQSAELFNGAPRSTGTNTRTGTDEEETIGTRTRTTNTRLPTSSGGAEDDADSSAMTLSTGLVGSLLVVAASFFGAIAL